jgi:WD40 repeat protein
MEPAGDGYKYWAFISYSHADDAQAQRLARAIERYRLPARLGPERSASFPKKLFPIFRDREEFAASANLGSALEDALRQSRALIVLCSPAARASTWVDAEIRTFRRYHGDDRIFAVLVDGEPGEAIPPALLERAPAGSGLSAEPLAVDLRSGRALADARLRLIAGILQVDFDALKRRAVAARRRSLLQLGLLAACIVAAFVVLGSRIVGQQHADASRRIAQRAALIADDRPDAALAAAALAFRTADTPAARSALLSALQASRHARRFVNVGAFPEAAAIAEDDSVVAYAYHPAGAAKGATRLGLRRAADGALIGETAFPAATGALCVSAATRRIAVENAGGALGIIPDWSTGPFTARKVAYPLPLRPELARFTCDARLTRIAVLQPHDPVRPGTFLAMEDPSRADPQLWSIGGVEGLNDIALSADGTRLALLGAAAVQPTFWVVDPDTRAIVRRCPVPADAGEIAISPAGDSVTTLGAGRAQSWDVRTCAATRERSGLELGTHELHYVDARHVAVVKENGDTLVWGVADTAPPIAIKSGLTVDGAFATGGLDGTFATTYGPVVAIWGLTDGPPLVAERKPARFDALTISTQGDRAVTSAAAWWRLPDLAPVTRGGVPVEPPVDLAAGDRELALLDRSGTRLRTFALDGTAVRGNGVPLPAGVDDLCGPVADRSGPGFRVIGDPEKPGRRSWYELSGKTLVPAAPFTVPERGPNGGCTISPLGTYVLMLTADGLFAFDSTGTRQLIAFGEDYGGTRNLPVFGFQPASDRVIAVGNLGAIRFARDGKADWRTIDVDERGAPTRLAVSAAGDTVAGGGSDGNVRLWDIASGVVLGDVLPAARTQPASAGVVTQVAFAPDGTLVTLSGDPNGGPARLATWLTDPQGWLRAACAKISGTLSADDWRTVVKEVPPAHAPCDGVEVRSVP